MTVSAAFELPGGGVARPELPICTSRVFREVIWPSANRLGLTFILAWDTMVEIDKSNYRKFVAELGALREDLHNSAVLSSVDKEYVENRLSALGDCIVGELSKESELVVTIG